MSNQPTVTPGIEGYETFTHGRQRYYQYDYRTTDGELFSCVGRTLTDCRDKRDAWLSQRQGEANGTY